MAPVTTPAPPALPETATARAARVVGLVAPALVLLALLLYAVRDVLSPLVVYALLAAALWPLRREPPAARLLAIASALVAVWLLWAAGSLPCP